MFIERLINQGNAPLLERTLEFTAQRHRLIAENVVNVDTPGYVQRDMSLEKFQGLLRRRVEDRRNGPPGATSFADIEKQVILSTLEQFKGHRIKTATALGIGVRTLGMKLKRWREEGEPIEVGA